MSRVEIEAGGRRIVIEHDTELAHITAEAQRLWDHTATATERETPGPAFGFTATPRYHPDVRPTNGGGSYTHRPFTPVTAETEQAMMD